MAEKMLSTFTKLLLVLFLLSLPSTGGERSGEREGSSENEGSSEVETTSEVSATTTTPTASSTTLAESKQYAGCGSSNLNTIMGRSESLQSPNYPENYPANSKCWWTITAPRGYHILLNFTTFDLEKNFDLLRLYDAPSQAEVTQPYTTISSEVISSTSILSNSNYVTVEFTSDYGLQLKGFALTYEAVAVGCPALPTPSNGVMVCYVGSQNTLYCTISCNTDFTISGSKRWLCQLDKSWTGNHVRCEKKKCFDLQVPENGRKSCTDGNYFDSRCSFTCNDGYVLYGSESRSCSRYGLWWSGWETSCQSSSPTPTCSVDRWLICDGKHDCPDMSDEKGCSCPHYKFKCDCSEGRCTTGWSCIKRIGRCDGWNQCGDWSDERDCQCSDTRFQCEDGDCIDRTRVNDGIIDCVNGDDEFICDKTQDHVNCDCMHDDDRCTSFGRCILNRWIGDTIPDCEYQNDEPCNASKVWCNGCWVIINRCSSNQSKNILMRKSSDNATRCSSITIPSYQTPILEINWICTTSPCGKCLDIFYCASGQVIDNNQYCDIVPQCKDGSDERTKGFGFRCSGKSGKGDCVLSQKNVYDSVAHCADSSDLCFVNGEFRCFSCLDGRHIVSAKQVCDGFVDCYDMSDECLCANQSVCDEVRGEERSRCPSHKMHCNNDTDCVDMNKVLCRSFVDCKEGSNRKFCHRDKRSSESIRCVARPDSTDFVTVHAARCDGRPECMGMEDECDGCKPRPLFCDSRCEKRARNGGYGNRVCDGYVNEVGMIPSCYLAVEKNCSMRFYCNSEKKISIDKRSVCDGIIDCDDQSDENITNCGNKRFYCIKRNTLSIDKALVCDGIEDCDKGEDEAHRLCAKRVSLFSDQYEMISSPILRALFWIMGLLALIGNMLVNLRTAANLISCKNTNDVKLANDIFILNLTISDFLMGVYLVAVAVQAKIYSGSYGLVDKKWRSSNLCSGLGTLAALSTETSAFIMAAMSTFRLVTVYNPFLSSSIKIKWIVIAGCSCWIFSFLLAVIPWFPFDSGFFVTDVWFPNLFTKTGTVSKRDMFTLAKRISSENCNPMSWFKVKATISDAFQYNPIKGEFGYYGETSVCMPRFYASTDEAAWQYSTFLITLNFVLFIYMMAAYLLVYKKASGMKKSRSTKKDPNKGMQKRISRLLLTDFSCWIPVCIMGYLSVAGVHLPPNSYIVSAGFLLPINSAMNPILYSKFLGQLAARAKEWITQKCFCNCSARKAVVVERCDAKTEEIDLMVIQRNDQTKRISNIL